jgi:thiazole synthase
MRRIAMRRYKNPDKPLSFDFYILTDYIKFMDELIIAGRTFHSRLLVGTGKFGSNKLMAQAVETSGTEIVTVSIRRMDAANPEYNILNFLDPKKYLLLANTSGAKTAEEAVRLARIAVAGGLPKWIKLELTPDLRYLLPDPVETLKAAEILVKEGWTVMPYINADPILAKKLEDAGTSVVMPLAAPIGSNQGLQTREMIEIIIEQSNVPVIVDAGIGRPSDAALCMELGADAVLVNTAIAVASDPVNMALAFKLSVEAGRMGYRAGIGPVSREGHASSPLTGFLGS